ncbi:cyclically-permuted mutarotase family protein [Shewanella sp. OMA3-2]|uniref:cyclically-permuted mutarotase family protein n=1 Tax=Shewanella sp. OMA3-2 TaxID=2908650 RepID=UPI001F1CFAD2|nr:cyclically-permuted mutarotase family protein [Shewanella sp. OMA3-2]UJF22922.1 cyclically-permuted mutarotase family protein [Shewanella sp. OMA3-2]
MKLIRLLLLLISAVLLVFNANATDKVEHDLQHDPSLDKISAISWIKAGQLPNPDSFVESIGISGAYSGFIGDYLIVAGGANFPNGHPFFEQGKKQFYTDIFVFNTQNNSINLVTHGHLPIKAGHGATLVVDNSLYLIGGKNNEQALDSIIKLTLDVDNTPNTEVIEHLPFTWHSGAAAWQGGDIYIFAGEQNGKVNNRVCQYSLTRKSCIQSEMIPSLPGANRTDFPAIHHQDKFYIFGGLNLLADKENYVLTDAYAFDFKKLDWTTLAPITLHKKPFSVTGGGAAVINNDQLVLLGGVNRDTFNDAIFQLTTQKNDTLTAFKQQYFSLSEQDINFSRQQMIYHIHQNKWSVLSNKVPFPGGAGPLTITQQGNKIYWVSGETKPVIRTPNIYQGTVLSNQ